MGTFEEIFKNYKTYSDKAIKQASISQAISSGGQYLYNNNAINNIESTNTSKIPQSSISLSSYDMTAGATRKVDQAFNSMLSYSREANRRINPQLLSSYSGAITNIEATQAQIDAETRNKAAGLNFNSRQRTSELNAGIEARNNETSDKLDMAKSGMKMSNLNSFAAGISNISNMQMKQKADLFSAQAGAKALDIQAKLAGYKEAGEPTPVIDYTKAEPPLQEKMDMIPDEDLGIDDSSINNTSTEVKAIDGGVPPKTSLFGNKIPPIKDEEYIDDIPSNISNAFKTVDKANFDELGNYDPSRTNPDSWQNNSGDGNYNGKSNFKNSTVWKKGWKDGTIKVDYSEWMRQQDARQPENIQKTTGSEYTTVPNNIIDSETTIKEDEAKLKRLNEELDALKKDKETNTVPVVTNTETDNNTQSQDEKIKELTVKRDSLIKENTKTPKTQELKENTQQQDSLINVMVDNETTEMESLAPGEKTFQKAKTEKSNNTIESNKGNLVMPIAKGTITRAYGKEVLDDVVGVSPEGNYGKGGEINHGVDITASKEGDGSINSVSDGTITAIQTVGRDTAIIIQYGDYRIVYKNVVGDFKKGDKIIKGQNLGKVGDTGIMNFQIWKGFKNLDPTSWLKQ